jgi:hypothetical protein
VWLRLSATPTSKFFLIFTHSPLFLCLAFLNTARCFSVYVPLTTSQKSETLNKSDNKKRRRRHIQADGIHECIEGDACK